MAGLALTLPMILLSGPVTGYFLSVAWLHYKKGPGYIMPLFMMIGLAASGIQTYRLINKLRQQLKSMDS